LSLYRQKNEGLKGKMNVNNIKHWKNDIGYLLKNQLILPVQVFLTVDVGTYGMKFAPIIIY